MLNKKLTLVLVVLFSLSMSLSISASIRQPLKPKISDKMPGKSLKIAVLGYLNNPYWFEVKAGVMGAKEILESRNTTVDWIVCGQELDVVQMEGALNACAAAGYDAISLMAVAPGIVPPINRVTERGIVMATYCIEPYAEDVNRLVFVGQHTKEAGQLAGRLMADALNGKGKVGIITGYFGVVSHEWRREGFEEVLEDYPDIEMVGRWENRDLADLAYDITQNMLTANPDLDGIYVTAGGPFGAARAIERANKSDQITFVCYDFTIENLEYLESGAIDYVIGDDPYGHGYAPVVYLYNYLVAGEYPPQKWMRTPMPVATQKDVAELLVELKEVLKEVVPTR